MASFFQPLFHHKRFFSKSGQTINYKKGEYLANSHDPNNWVFFLVDGLVSVGFSSDTGESRLIGYFLPGMTFAQSGTFFEEFITVQLDYKACTDSKVLRVNRQVFLEKIHQDTGLNTDYITALLRNQIFLIERITYQSEKGVYKKCIRWLLFMAKFYGIQDNDKLEIQVPITQELAANFMNITRESAAAALKKLKHKKLISFKSKRATIHNPTLLQQELG
jgi:CRP/FNR family transcriptional regulator